MADSVEELPNRGSGAGWEGVESGWTGGERSGCDVQLVRARELLTVFIMHSCTQLLLLNKYPARYSIPVSLIQSKFHLN